jgi:hypothetical protein
MISNSGCRRKTLALRLRETDEQENVLTYYLPATWRVEGDCSSMKER